MASLIAPSAAPGAPKSPTIFSDAAANTLAYSGLLTATRTASTFTAASAPLLIASIAYRARFISVAAFSQPFAVFSRSSAVSRLAAL
jgi:hypothetical protein